MMSTPTSLPPIPEEVVVEFVMPYAFDCLRDALHLMLVCRRAHRAATTNHSFWEPFLWRRFHQEVFHRLKLAYHKYARPLIDLLRAYSLSFFVSLCPFLRSESHGYRAGST